MRNKVNHITHTIIDLPGARFPRCKVAHPGNNFKHPTEENAYLIGDMNGFCARVLIDGHEDTMGLNWMWIKFTKGVKLSAD